MWKTVAVAGRTAGWSAACVGAVAVASLFGLAGSASAVALPDGRGFELVSPASGKNGADVMANSQRVRVAADGSAVAFSSLTAFGDALGTGVATDYMSMRVGPDASGGSGWVTHAITPPQDPLSLNGVLNADPMYVGDMSSDLDGGVFEAWSPVTDNSMVAQVQNLYVRRDLRSAGAGSYALASPCPLCDATSTPLPPPPDGGYGPDYGGASEDFTHVVFEQIVNRTSDAGTEPAGCATLFYMCLPRAYEWTAGGLRLVGYVPSGAAASCSGGACVPAPAAILGQGVHATRTPNTPVSVISADGRRVFFTVPTDDTGAVTDGRQLSGRLYMRTDGTTTDQLDTSERTDCAGDPTCGGNGVPDPEPVGYSPATFWGASVDGSRVFFTTAEALTDDAPVTGEQKLYMYDASKPVSDPHNLTYVNVAQQPTSNNMQAVVAESADGQYVYFITTGQLLPGEPSADYGLYAWHDGVLRFIGSVLPGETSDMPTTSTNYALIPPQGRVTPDGSRLLFSAHNGSGLSTNYDHGSCVTSIGRGCEELYVYDALDGRLACASCNPSGAPATANAVTGVRRNAGGSLTTWHQNHAITDDGSRVFFTTGEALVPGDVNGRADVYEYRTPTPDHPSGQVFLITTGTSTSDSYFMDTTPNGSDVFFVTRERLVSWDTDDSYDLYDARVGGGFPERAAPVPSCAAGSCQGLPVAAPAAPSIASVGLAGAGNVVAHFKPAVKRCRKGFVRKRVRGRVKCVKRAHRKRSTRRARRAGPAAEGATARRARRAR